MSFNNSSTAGITTTNSGDGNYNNLNKNTTRRFVQISEQLSNPPSIISDIRAARHSRRAISIQSVASAPSLPYYVAKLLLPRALDALDKSRGAIVFDPISGVYEPNLYNLIDRHYLEDRSLPNTKTLRKILNYD